MREVIYLNIATQYSPKDCALCLRAEDQHIYPSRFCANSGHRYKAMGWRDLMLGVSFGFAWNDTKQVPTWFEASHLRTFITAAINSDVLLVTFNGQNFDRRLIWSEAFPDGDVISIRGDYTRLWNRSYDLLYELWEAVPDLKFVRGVNSLGALLKHNKIDFDPAHDADLAIWIRGDDDDKRRAFEYMANKANALRQLVNMISDELGVLHHPTGVDVMLPYVTKEGDIVRPSVNV